MTPRLLNAAWLLACRGEALRFGRALDDVARTQHELLARILARNGGSAYGARHGFAGIRTAADYQARVPVVGPECLQADLAAIAAGGQRVLTNEPVELLVPTGGSGGGARLVPYTRSLRREFQRALAAWIWSSLHRHAAARRGRAYWSITPLAQARRQSGGLRIGFECDSEYLGWWHRWAASRLLAAPPAIARLQSMDNARYATLCHLLACGDLALVSVWSPLFLTALLDAVPAWAEAICRDLAAGCIRLPNPTAEPVPVALPLRPQPRRAALLRDLLHDAAADDGDRWRRCWPALSLVSCWGDGASAAYVPAVQRRLPHAAFEPKGLLATEGVVTIPWGDGAGAALAIRSHFFEFEALDESPERRPRLANELESGCRYRVLLTTGGGLYRYRLGDHVEVVGHAGRCPRLRFIGRDSDVSDLVGEKLHADHVGRATETALQEAALAPELAILVPIPGPPARYCLVIAGLDRPTDGQLAQRVTSALDRGLADNPHYALARRLHQLEPPDCRIMPASAATLWTAYERRQIAAGRRAGDLKPTALDARGDWVWVLEPTPDLQSPDRTAR